MFQKILELPESVRQIFPELLAYSGEENLIYLKKISGESLYSSKLLLPEKSTLEDKEKHSILLTVIEGIKHLNQIGVAHLDTHGANVMFDKNARESINTTTLIDFGGSSSSKDIHNTTLSSPRDKKLFDNLSEAFDIPRNFGVFHRGPEYCKANNSFDGELADRLNLAGFVCAVIFGYENMLKAVDFEPNSNVQMVISQKLLQTISPKNELEKKLLKMITKNYSPNPQDRIYSTDDLLEIINEMFEKTETTA